MTTPGKLTMKLADIACHLRAAAHKYHSKARVFREFADGDFEMELKARQLEINANDCRDFAAAIDARPPELMPMLEPDALSISIWRRDGNR